MATKPHKIPIYGQELRNDRKNSNLSGRQVEDILASRGLNFTDIKIRRSERENEVDIYILEHLANIYGKNPEKYKQKSDGITSTFGIVGHWIGLSIEYFDAGPPCIIEEKVEFYEKAGLIRGRSRVITDGMMRNESYENIRMFNRYIMGNVTVVDFEEPGYFQLQAEVGGNLLDGVTSWCDYGVNRILWSRNILVRVACVDHARFFDMATKLMKDELILFEGRFGRNPLLQI